MIDVKLTKKLFEFAYEADESYGFPETNIAILKDANLFSCFVPKKLGGREITHADAWNIASKIGGGCLSTALIWAMHTQQVAVLTKINSDWAGDVLVDLRNQKLIASVTSEYGTGADLMTSNSPIIAVNDKISIDRAAPVVSYAENADYFLVKMLSSERGPATAICALLVEKKDISLSIKGDWPALGMRGTRSVPIQLTGIVDSKCLLPARAQQLFAQVMAPIGHLLWAASWFGAAKYAFSRYVANSQRSKLKDSESSLKTISEIRILLDVIESMLIRGGNILDENKILTAKDYIFFNNIKIISSENAFEIIRRLIELAGVREGYMQGSKMQLERIFRDINAAVLMFPNERLKIISGVMALASSGSEE